MRLLYSNIKSLFESSTTQILAIRRKELMLEIGNLFIHFSFDIDDYEGDDDGFPHIDQLDISSWLAAHELTAVVVTREAVADDGDYSGNETFHSMLAVFLRHINAEFHDVVREAKVGYYEYRDDYSTEPNPLSYGFIGSISEEYWNNKKFFDWLIIESRKSYPIEKINDNISINLDNSQYSLFIAPNSLKTRRFGYLKMILGQFKDRDVIPELKLLKDINAHVDEYESDLKRYKNTTGLILASKTGSSLKPYTELAQRLLMINKNQQLYQVGKTSKAYLQGLQFGDNVFNLNLTDKCFFLESLLTYDYVYIFAILYYAFTHEGCTYVQLKNNFQNEVLGYLRTVADENGSIPIDKKLRLLNVIGRIKKWQKPEVYLDHVLIPRLNWLYDLDIIELQNDLSFTLTKAGIRLSLCMTLIQDVTHTQTTNIKNGLNAVMMRTINNIYDLQYRCFGIEDSSILDELINNSFSIFKTLAGNRVTLSVMTTYIKLQMLEQYKTVIDADDIARYINNNNRYILKVQRSYGDGYVQRR